MSYALSILSDQPDCIYMLDDTAPFQDYSQNGRNGSFVGTAPRNHASLVSGAKYAKVFDSNSVGSFESKVFSYTNQDYSFTLEAWVRVASIEESEQQILGNDGNFDGLTINGSVVSFSTKYEDGTRSTASYDVQTNRRMHVVGIHTKTKNSLYIDGELVSESGVSNVQAEMDLMGISSNLFCGQSLGNQKIAVAGIAAYNFELNPDAIEAHFISGHVALTDEEVTFMHDGITSPTAIDRAGTVIEQYWNSDEHWYVGDLENVSVQSGMLVPDFDVSLSLAGRWTESFILSQTEDDTIHGVIVSWEGNPGLMEYSLDGEDWYTLENNMPVEGITSGMPVEDGILTIRVTFTEGLTDDEEYLNELRVTAIYPAHSLGEHGIKTIYNKSCPRFPNVPAYLSDSWGLISMTPGASIELDDEHAEPILTLEMWVRRLDNTTIQWDGTRFINGIQSPTVPPPGEWFLLTLVSTEPIVDAVSLGNNIQIGSIAAYDRQLTASEVASIYSTYSGTNTVAISENSGLAVAESPLTSGIYATDWALQSG